MNYILSGMSFGDEGKGSFVDFLAYYYNIKNIVRYNGGCQASHTVTLPNGSVHKFSQLGSGMFYKDCKTYLTNNTVVNLFNLIEEIRVFTDKTTQTIQEVLDNVIIDGNCPIVTPFHVALNRIKEIASMPNNRGSVGTGVSEVLPLLDKNLGIRVIDLYRGHGVIVTALYTLREYVFSIYEENKDKINSAYYVQDSIAFLLDIESVLKTANRYRELTKTFKFKICDPISYYDQPMIGEGSQGLLLDRIYGIKPNTTFVDTTNRFFFKASKRDHIRVGVVKAFFSRHGKGVFPTETELLHIVDTNQECTVWNGRFRIGWFDAVLVRYAQRVNRVDCLFVSALDKLSMLNSCIYICNSYEYIGRTDDESFEFDEFFELFDASHKDDKIIIRDIKQASPNITKYLEKCQPIYTHMPSWNEDIRKINTYDALPENCKNYINTIAELTGIQVRMVSVGPTRNNKIFC